MNRCRLIAACLVLASVPAYAADDKKPAGDQLQFPTLPDLNGNTLPKEDPSAKKAADPNAQSSKSPEVKEKPKRVLDVSHMLFDHEAVQTVVKFHMPEIQECYEQVLADTNSKIEGRVTVGFIVDPAGNVTQAKAVARKSTMKEQRIVECVTDNVRQWVFPKTGDNRDHPIEYPFVLKVIK